jgi:Protein of unknown function (DUF2924)
MSSGRHSGAAAENLSPQRSPSQAETLDLTVAGLDDLDAEQLRLQWRNHLGGTAPAHLPRWLLLRVLAYRLQAAALGDLDKATVRSIRVSQGDANDFVGSPFKTRKPRTRNGIGLNRRALLVREWKGKLERVIVLDKGFTWNGQTFGSLSQVAKAVTGTSWNGHRFFGLRSVKDHGSKSPVPRLSGNEDRGRGAARSEDHGRTEIKDDGGEGSNGIGRDETERPVANAKSSGEHLTRRRASSSETKSAVRIEGEPRRERMDACP